MKSKNEVKPNTKKIIFEMILISLCIFYLYYMAFDNHLKASLIISGIVNIITCIEFLVFYIKEVYVYESKSNFLKIITIILNFVLIGLIIANIFTNKIKIVLLVTTIIFLVFVLYFVIKNIIRIIKGKGTLYKNTFAAFFALISFMIILANVIINYI